MSGTIANFSWNRDSPQIYQLYLEQTRLVRESLALLGFFSICFQYVINSSQHSRFTGQQGKGEGIYLTPLYHFHPLHRRLDISRVIAAGSSPLHIASSRTRTGKPLVSERKSLTTKLRALYWPSGLGNCFVCNKFTVQTLQWSLEFVIHKKS